MLWLFEAEARSPALSVNCTSSPLHVSNEHYYYGLVILFSLLKVSAPLLSVSPHGR